MDEVARAEEVREWGEQASKEEVPPYGPCRDLVEASEDELPPRGLCEDRSKKPQGGRFHHVALVRVSIKSFRGRKSTTASL